MYSVIGSENFHFYNKFSILLMQYSKGTEDAVAVSLTAINSIIFYKLIFIKIYNIY